MISATRPIREANIVPLAESAHAGAHDRCPCAASLLLTIPQAAAALAVNRSTVYLLLQHGELASVRLGRARRIPRAELGRWIAEHTEAA
jgi:excisionase family DNA binding protein